MGQFDGPLNRPMSSNSPLPPDLTLGESSNYFGSQLNGASTILMNYQSKSSLTSNDEAPSLGPLSFNSNYSTPSGLATEDTSSSSRGTTYHSIVMAAEQDILKQVDETENPGTGIKFVR